MEIENSIELFDSELLQAEGVMSDLLRPQPKTDNVQKHKLPSNALIKLEGNSAGTQAQTHMVDTFL